MRNSESGSGNNFNLLMPIAMLAVLLIVPFSINAVMHMMAAKRLQSPLVMKIPFDSTAISIPSEVKQYDSFEVALNLDTKQFSRILNEIIVSASEGTSIQGVTGTVSPYMKAAVVSETFRLDKQGAQDPFSAYDNVARWRWLVTPESSGTQSLKFQLHVTAQQNGQSVDKVLDFAEAHFAVQSNLTEWFNRNGLWGASLLAIVVFAVWKLRQRYAV